VIPRTASINRKANLGQPRLIITTNRWQRNQMGELPSKGHFDHEEGVVASTRINQKAYLN
jgi:hypothetical protein